MNNIIQILKTDNQKQKGSHMKEKIHSISFIIFIAIYFITAQTPVTTDAPSEVLTAAKTDFINYLTKRIPNNTKEMIGLSADDNLGEAALGTPIQLHYLSAESITYKRGAKSAQSYLSATTMWYFPIILSGKMKLMLYVDKMNGSWKKVGLGSAGLATELDDFCKQWIDNGKNEVILAQQQNLGVYLFHVPQLGPNNLTVSQSEKRNDPNRYKHLNSLSTTIQVLKDKIK